jgi:uncharacterized protein DUF4245
VVSTGSTDEGSGPTDEGSGPADEGSGPTDEEHAPTVGGAAAARPGRYQRSPAGMVGALIVTVLVILAFVAFRALNRSDLDVEPQHVDYLAQVKFAQEDATGGRSDLVYPARLPSGWYATHLSFSDSAAAPEIELSMLTADDRYVGFVQSPATVPELLTTYVDPHPQSGPPTRVEGSIARRWQTWTDSGGDTALAARHGKDAVLVFGTVSQDQLERLAASLTTAPVGG